MCAYAEYAHSSFFTEPHVLAQRLIGTTYGSCFEFINDLLEKSLPAFHQEHLELLWKKTLDVLPKAEHYHQKIPYHSLKMGRNIQNNPHYLFQVASVNNAKTGDLLILINENYHP